MLFATVRDYYEVLAVLLLDLGQLAFDYLSRVVSAVQLGILDLLPDLGRGDHFQPHARLGQLALPLHHTEHVLIQVDICIVGGLDQWFLVLFISLYRDLDLPPIAVILDGLLGWGEEE